MKGLSKKILVALMLVALIITCALTLASCDSGEDAKTEILSVEINKDKEKVTLNATLDAEYAKNHSEDTLYLLCLPTADTAKIGENAKVISEIKVKAKLKAEFDLYDENGFTRLTHAFCIAEKSGGSYSALTKAVYIQNPEILADKNASPAQGSGIKGYAGNDLYDGALLGASHTLLELDIDKAIRQNYYPGTISYNYDGITYYFDEAQINELDGKVEDAARLGMRIYLRTALRYSSIITDASISQLLSKPIDALYCENVGALGSASRGYLVNMQSDEAHRAICAFYSFLANRYSGEKGVIADYIIGENVNDYNKYCFAGAIESDELEKTYHSWLRAASLTLKSVNPDAMVYTSVDNTWRADSSSATIGGKSFLTKMSSLAEDGGDFDFGIALNLGDGYDLPAALSGNGFNASKMSIASLDDFFSFLDGADMRYKSERRRFIIDNLELSTDISEENRAAYYACAYYNAAKNGFDAIIYSSYDDTSLYSKDNAKSHMYYAFLMCGTDKHAQLENYTRKLATTMPEMSEYVVKTLEFDQNAAKYEIPDAAKKHTSAFPVRLDGLKSGGSLYNAQMILTKDTKGEYERVLCLEALMLGGVGVASSEGVVAGQIANSKYVGIRLSSKTSPRIALVMTTLSGDKTYIGEAQTVNGEATYYFDIADFAGTISEGDKLNVSICIIPDGKSSQDMTLEDLFNSSSIKDVFEVEEVEINEITLYGSSATQAETIITIVIVIACVLVFGGLITLLVIRRKKKAHKATNED